MLTHPTQDVTVQTHLWYKKEYRSFFLTIIHQFIRIFMDNHIKIQVVPILCMHFHILGVLEDIQIIYISQYYNLILHLQHLLLSLPKLVHLITFIKKIVLWYWVNIFSTKQLQTIRLTWIWLRLGNLMKVKKTLMHILNYQLKP